MAEDIKDQETTDEAAENATLAATSEAEADAPEQNADGKAFDVNDSNADNVDAEGDDSDGKAFDVNGPKADEADDATDENGADIDASEQSSDDSEEPVDAVVSSEPSHAEVVMAPSHDEVAVEPKGDVAGVACFFDHPEHLMFAASQARDAKFERFDALSPFPIHGMDEAMGLGRSWIPWVTLTAGTAGFITAASLQFGIMAFDWPMVFGGKPFIAWPSFVPIMFELTVLFAGVTTAIVMLIAAGCFRKPLIVDRSITNDRFALWIAADDTKFDRDQVVEFMKSLNPTEIRTVTKDGK